MLPHALLKEACTLEALHIEVHVRRKLPYGANSRLLIDWGVRRAECELLRASGFAVKGNLPSTSAADALITCLCRIADC